MEGARKNGGCEGREGRKGREQGAKGARARRSEGARFFFEGVNRRERREGREWAREARRREGAKARRARGLPHSSSKERPAEIQPYNRVFHFCTFFEFLVGIFYFMHKCCKNFGEKILGHLEVI